MSDKTITINGKQFEIVSSSRGWVKYLDDNGSIKSVRGNANGASKPKANGKAAPAKAAKPVKAAKPTKAAKPVKAATPGVRTIGATEVDLSHYQRVVAKSGNVSYDNGDKVAKELRECTLDEVYRLAGKALKEDLEAATIDDAEKILRKKYGHLNAGMQRMNLGNRYRAALRAA